MVYLDYAATVPMLPEVTKAMREAEQKFYANASALHTPGHLAMNEIEECRELLAEMINAKPSEIIFTSGASESNNTVIRTFEGHKIETSLLEHHSIIEAAKVYRGDKEPGLYSCMLANNETGEFLDLCSTLGGSCHALSSPTSHRLRGGPPPRVFAFGNSRPEGRAPADVVSSDLSPDGLKSSMSCTSNLSPADVISSNLSLADDKSSSASPVWYFHSDLTQVLGKIPIDVEELGLDYATFSAHKIGGPIGVGALYVREGVPFKPLIIGGNQEKKRRGGTYNTVGIAGFKQALETFKNRGDFEIYDKKIRKLRDTLAKRILAEIPGSSLNTDIRKNKSLPNILNASFKAAEGESIQLYLDAEGIIVSTGSACAAGDIKPSHVLMAKTGDAEIAHSSIRFSFGPENTMEDVNKVMEVLPGIVDRLQKISTIDT